MTRSLIIAGAGAFGTALAISWHRAGCDVTLVGRNIATLRDTGRHPGLDDMPLPEGLKLTDRLSVTQDDILLLAVPMQALDGYLETTAPEPFAAIACCKGFALDHLVGPTGIMARHLRCPNAILTGPSFARDVAMGLPTALVLACKDAVTGEELRAALATPMLRLYHSDDPLGAELGGALKNVIALACGICIGAGLGESARASLMTRGYAEMKRLAQSLGAQPQTLAGLSGFGDLALTCTSRQSRNFSCGLALGSGQPMPKATTEGIATASAISRLAAEREIEMPVTEAVAGVLAGSVTIKEALEHLLARPAGRE